MSKLPLSVAIGNYDRARPLFDGTVQIDGVDPVMNAIPAVGEHTEAILRELGVDTSTITNWRSSGVI